ncbi:MAG: sodium:proton antiporter NhaD [Paludibacteraceae bacterium]|nr:sodium:proton antiporter NhaD [Paludibacteraceae bacterium]
MEILMIVVFLIGYSSIAMEHPLKVNKAASALLLCAILWTIYVLNAEPILLASSEFIEHFNLSSLGDAVASLPDLHEKVIKYVTEVQIIEGLGDVASTLFFLMGAMTIVELIDAHRGFSIITDRITTQDKKKLLWMLSFITFFMSAVLDNLTTTIVMVMLLRKLVADKSERWRFACLIVIAANAGGAFSPIGDVTTIMLWVKGNITTAGVIPNLFIPSLFAMIIPLMIETITIKGDVVAPKNANNSANTADIITDKERKTIFILGIGALVFVPIFKTITHLPPFIGVLFGLGVLWVYTELLYHNKKQVPENAKARISVVLKKVDFTTILFFLGILMAVNALQCAGILAELADFLDKTVGNPYLIDIIIGVLSSIVDNVPLVAGCMGMYDVTATGVFATDGVFWMFLAYCAGVGGSILIIGSAAGVVVMGLEKVDFGWYLKNISLLALIGYLSGAGFFILQEEVIRPLFGL